MPKKLLFVDDNDGFRDLIKSILIKNKFAVVTAKDGSDGFLLAKETKPDLILLDANMPGLDGHTLCRIIKKDQETSRIPVIILTGLQMTENDVVSGLESGADDYILKPCPLKVLIARINAVLRRYDSSLSNINILHQHNIDIDPEAREVRVNGILVCLTRKEFDLLILLVERMGRVLNSGFILETIWGYDLADHNDPHTIETHISRLRKKLGPQAAKWITNVQGLGYKFEKDQC